MYRWFISISIVLLIGCKSIKPISPTLEELEFPENFNNYALTDLDHHPIQTIRVSIHVLQDSIGHGNFTIADSLNNHAPEWYWLQGLVEDASKRMGDLQPMQMPSSSNYIKDSRIRYKVVGVYDWQDQGLFNLSRAYPSTGDRMYDHIMQQEEVTHKENSLHLFLAGGINNDNGKITSRGIASGAPDKRWTVLFNYYNQYKRKKSYWPASLISHELGHNLGLSHTWNRADGCDDTPRKEAQCWALNEPKSKACDELSECSNNLMDYNVWQNALSECQLAKIHYNIKYNRGNLQDIIETANTNSGPSIRSIQGDRIIESTAEFILEGATAGSKIKWYITPRDAVTNPIGNGNRENIKASVEFVGKANITFMIIVSGIEENKTSLDFRIKKSQRK